MSDKNETNHQDHFRALKELKHDTTEVLMYHLNWQQMDGRWQIGPKSENRAAENYRQLQSASFYQTQNSTVRGDAQGGVKWHSHRSDQADTVCLEFQTALEIKLPRHKRKSPLVNYCQVK